MSQVRPPAGHRVEAVLQRAAMLWSALPAPLVGGPARLVGYGQTVYEEPNSEKYSVDTVLAAIDAGDTITVGDPDHRSCIGDSGGPALVEIDGVETVIGVNSYADLAGCLEAAHYRRTDLYVDFLAEFIEPPSDGGSGGAGGSGGDTGGANTGGAGDGETDAGGCSVAVRGGTSVSWFVGLMVLFGRRRRLSRIGAR